MKAPSLSSFGSGRLRRRCKQVAGVGLAMALLNGGLHATGAGGAEKASEEAPDPLALPVETAKIPEPSVWSVLVGGAGLLMTLNHWRRRRRHR